MRFLIALISLVSILLVMGSTNPLFADDGRKDEGSQEEFVGSGNHDGIPEEGFFREGEPEQPAGEEDNPGGLPAPEDDSFPGQPEDLSAPEPETGTTGS